MRNDRVLELHPDAAKIFNDKASSLLCEIAPLPAELQPNHKPSFQSDGFVSGHIKEKDIIGEIKLSLVDHTGKEMAKIFRYNGKEIGFYGDNYKKLVNLAEDIQRTATFHDTVSVILVKDLLFEWMKERYEDSTALLMTEYLLAKCKESLKELEIWIPIAMTNVQSEIEIGNVVIKSITRNMIDRWQKDCCADTQQDKAKIEEHFRKVRRNLQGLASATVTLFAEPLRACEIAFAEAEKSIGILRFYSPANFFPELCSHCTILGKESIETVKYLVFKDGKIIQEAHTVCGKSALPWSISDDLVSQMMLDGLKVIGNMLTLNNLTDFQKSLLNALMLYSRSSIAKNVNDKLVYILVSLESILLLGTSESIQQNVGERMAFIIGKNVNDRQAVIKNLKKAYALRSSFIHHGRSIKDFDIVRNFMRNAWLVFRTLIKNAEQFSSREQLIDMIERQKLS
jgi:hypothetical protein